MRAAFVALAVAAVLLAGCGGGGSGGELLPDAPARMGISSIAFQNGGLIPKRYTCSGAGSSPPLAILHPPARTRELALVVEDPDAGNFLHWTVLGIPPSTRSLGSRPPAGAVETKNGFGDHGWGAPCPPKGDKPHRYLFAVYALDVPLGLARNASADEVHSAIAKHALARGTLTGRFGR